MKITRVESLGVDPDARLLEKLRRP